MEALPNPEDIKPGWNNGVIELLDPVELGWRLIKKTVTLELPGGSDEPRKT